MQIPLLDLKKQYEIIKHKIEPEVSKVMGSAQYIMGDNVESFESQIAEYLGCRFALTCANGTDALILALHALGIGSGDEVITTPFTFFATAEAISRVGAIPVFVDVFPDTYNINPSKIEEKVTGKTKAIMPVHLFGLPVQMDEIMEIAKNHDLFVIEDACQAMGASYRGKKAGTIGDVGCFSFFPTKNLSCFGDGGLVITDCERTAKIIMALRSHGGGKSGEEAYRVLNTVSGYDSITNDMPSDGMEKYYNYIIGFNSRLDEIQAAILRVKLEYLDKWNEKRKQLAWRYNSELKNTSLALHEIIYESGSIFHQYVILSEKKDELCKYLKDKGISTGAYYPVPLHLQKAYISLGYKEGDLPVAEYLSKRSFALPIYPELTDEEQNYIISSICRFEGAR